MSFRPQEHRKECSDCGESIALNARRMKRRLLNKDANMPNVFIPGVAQAMRLLYGTDYYAIRPVDVVAAIMPRSPLLHSKRPRYRRLVRLIIGTDIEGSQHRG